MPKVSEYPAISALDDDDLLVIVEDGATKKVTVAELRSALNPAWTAWTPVLSATTTPPTLGTGSSVAGRYTQRGKTVHGWGAIAFGTSGVSAGNGTYSVAPPVVARESSAVVPNVNLIVGSAMLRDHSTGIKTLASLNLSGANWIFRAYDGGGTNAVDNDAPWVWAAEDTLEFEFMYEAA